jgi:hypothetical protein
VDQKFEKLTTYAKAFTGLTPELEDLLKNAGPQIIPRLSDVTEDFYNHLSTIPETAPFLEGRIDALKAMHVRWMEALFSGTYDPAYVESMYKVGYVHVKVNLPVQFMAGAMTLINNRLCCLLVETYADDTQKLAKILKAVSAITGMSLFVMQQAYQNASIAEELEKFLKITGMSRVLFANLATAYKDK